VENTSQDGFPIVAGWTTPFPAATFLLYLHPIPRPYGYWTQFVADIRGYKPRILWIGSAGLIALGLALSPAREPGWAIPLFAVACIVVGGHVLLGWFGMFLQAVDSTRTSPLDVGVIRTLKAPPWPDMALAEAVLADGTVVEVAVFRAIVDRFLNTYGECEVLFKKDPRDRTIRQVPPTMLLFQVLFRKRPRDRRAKTDTGFVIAAREILQGDGRHATEPVLHWTGLNQAKRLELEQIARKVGYPIDAVFFVLSALSLTVQKQARAVEQSSLGDRQESGRHVTAQEFCQSIPEHAVKMFGSLPRASAVLSAWGLWTGEDVGAIVGGCNEAGWLKPEPRDSIADFQGLGPLIASNNQHPQRHATAQGEQKVPGWWLLYLLRIGFTLAVLPGYVLWTERLTLEERPLVGRWYAPGARAGEDLTLVELGPDHSFRMQILRRENVAPAERSQALQWAARDGRIFLTAPTRSYEDRVNRAYGLHAMGMEAARWTPDADRLEMKLGDAWVVFRRVPEGLASVADLFPRRPANGGQPRPEVQ
jgi:uncharacterized repeat protein (TIGR04138 family)